MFGQGDVQRLIGHGCPFLLCAFGALSFWIKTIFLSIQNDNSDLQRTRLSPLLGGDKTVEYNRNRIVSQYKKDVLKISILVKLY